MRASSGEALVDIARMLKHEDLAEHVLTIVIEFTTREEQEHLRMMAPTLLNMLAKFWVPKRA